MRKSDTQEKHYTYSQIIQRAVRMMLQVEVFEGQFKWAAMAGFQPPVAFRAVVVRHWVVGRREYACGGGEVAPTTYRRNKWTDTHLFFLVKASLSVPNWCYSALL